MSIEKVWVLAESADGVPTSTTLELLTEARSMGGTTEAVAWGPDTAAVAGELGNYGASAVHDVGDIGDALPGAPVAAARSMLSNPTATLAIIFTPSNASIPAGVNLSVSCETTACFPRTRSCSSSALRPSSVAT